MRSPDLQALIDAWSATEAGLDPEESHSRILGYVAMLEAIAERGSVSSDALAVATGTRPERIAKLFESLASAGFEMDDAGNVVGAALTTRPTPHAFRVKDRDLYAWCALDALFLPGLLDETAEVASTCPVSGDEIRLTVTPEGVRKQAPSSAVLTVVIPQELSMPGGTGPASPT